MKKVLGKGLEALIPQSDKIQSVSEVDIKSIIPNKYQMRVNFNRESLEEMAVSLKENGMIQPLIVRKHGDGCYMLVAGERRWRSAQIAGLKKVPVIVKKMDSESALSLSLIENIQREDLSPIEEASAYERMIKEFSFTQSQISEKVGKSRSSVANSLRILSLPAFILEFIDSGRMSSGHAKALLSIKNEKKIKALAERVVREKLTVRETEKLANMASGKAAEKIGQRKKLVSDDSDIEEQRLKFEMELGTRVRIKTKQSRDSKQIKGKIEIEFYSLDDFGRLSNLICSKK